MRGASVTALVLGVSLCGIASAADGPLPAATQDLLRAYPAARVAVDDGRVTAIYGAPMVEAPAPDAAVDQWLANHKDALGVADLDLRPMRANLVGLGQSTVYAHQQFIDNVPVEYGFSRILVRNGPTSQVVYVGARLATPPAAGFAPDTVTADQAVASVQNLPAYANLTFWSQPQLVIYYGEGDGVLVTPVRAWKFYGRIPELDRLESYAFYVNAANGNLVFVRDEIYHTDVVGNVSGNASPGVLPDVSYNLPTVQPLENLTVQIQGGNSALTDEAGDYTVPNGGTSQVTVDADLVGPWVTVNNNAGAELHLESSVTPPGPADFVFNSAPSGSNTSQVNGYIHTNLIHDFYKDRQPDYTGLDTAIPCNVNINLTCNAGFDPFAVTINFYQTGGGCVNSAYSSVVAHEYGHFIVHAHNLAQGSFGEGLGDSAAILLYDDPIVARDFFGPGQPIRDIVGANQQYPCSAEIHTCGQVLAGVWWDTKLNMQDVYGDELGLELTQQLFTDWMEITTGGSGNDSAHPGTAIEVLTADDDDGNIDNGSPNYDFICDAFAAHNIDCPEISPVIFEYPEGRPAILPPNQQASILVNLVPVSATPTPGAATVSYRAAGGSFTTVSMTELGDNQFEANFPVGDCNEVMEFYFSTGSTVGVVSDPSDAPTDFYQAVAATDIVTAFADDFETNLGWTVGDTGDDATTGVWTRVDPVGTAAQPEDDHTDSGTVCWVTGQGVPGGDLGANDIDNGKTTLKTPVLDLSTGDAKISYWRWYSNNTGATPNTDVFVVDISNNGGTNWTNVETVGPSGIETSGGWYYHEFLVSSFVTPTNNVIVRFVASDEGSGSLVEAALDDVLVEQFACDDVPPAIIASDPAADSVDARQPSEPDGTSPAAGFDSVVLTFDADPSALTPADFATSEDGGDGIAVGVESVTPIGGNDLLVTFDAGIEQLAWTTLTHTASGTSVRLGHLPGDVDGDGTSGAVDLLTLIDVLNGVTSRPLFATDVDRSGATNPVDVLRVVDLLNGAGVYDPYLGVSLP